MIFKITNNDIFEDNPELKAIPVFSDLTDRQLRYIFFTYDYESPYRKLELSVRKEKCAIVAGYKTELQLGKVRLDKNGRDVVNGNVESVNKAIKYFMEEVQRDFEKEALVSYDTLIDDYKKIMNKPNKNDKEIETAIKVRKDYVSAIQERKKIIEALGVRQEELSKDESLVKEMSAIDKFNAARSGKQ